MAERVSLDDFSLLSVIGKGSYGKVLLVRKNDSGELYAMKMLKKEHIVRRNQVERTRTERRILELMNHPFIVKLNYAFRSSVKLYFVIDYCPGGELFFHLAKERRFEEARTRFYAACIVLAIEYLHSLDIVYRDLKPENILIDKDGYIKITDFGLSKEAIEGNDGAFSFVGTPEYLAPEIVTKTGHGKAVDWWCFGCLIFEMLNGIPPYYAKDKQKLFDSILYGDVKFPAFMSPGVKDLISRLLTKDPNHRLGTNGTDDIKAHPWFAEINWDSILRREIAPPFLPTVDEDYVDDEFSSIPPVDSGANAPVVQTNTFKGFSYLGKNE